MTVFRLVRNSSTAAQTAARKAVEQLQRTELRQTQMPTGLIVASYDNLSPIARIVVYIKAGSRFETNNFAGVTHKMRFIAGMTTTQSTIFGITRNMEYLGGSLTAETTRDQMIYRLSNIRDFSKANLKYLADTVTRPAFKEWQFDDYRYRLETEIDRAIANPQVTLIDELHRNAFRGGLANSIYCSKEDGENIDPKQLSDFFNNHYHAKNMCVVGVGVDHDLLTEAIGNTFAQVQASSIPTVLKSKFKGGESRVIRNIPITLAAVTSEGVSASNLKDLLALSLFESIVQSDAYVKDSNSVGQLSRAVSKVAKNPFYLQTLNLNYAESGLFGFTVAADPSEIDVVVKTAVSKLRDTAKNLKEEDLVAAK